MGALLLLLRLLLGVAPAPPPSSPASLDLAPRYSVATSFSTSANDPFNPDDYLPCLHRRLADSDLVIAASWLPCGTEALVFLPRNNQGIVVKVGDRLGRSLNRDGIDMAPAVTRALRARGMEVVLVVPLVSSPAWSGAAAVEHAQRDTSR